MLNLQKMCYVLLIILVAGFLETASATQVMFHQNDPADSFFDITYRIDSNANSQRIGSFFDVFFDTTNNSFFDITYKLPGLSNSFFDVFFEPQSGLNHSFFDITYRSGNPGPSASFFDVFRTLYPPDPGATADSFFDVFFDVKLNDSFFDVFTDISIDPAQRNGRLFMTTHTQVPEPSTVLLMVSGLLGLVSLVAFKRFRSCR